jgi:hypothetical protein
VVGIVNAAVSQLALTSFFRDRFPATAELRAVNWAQLISTESHGLLQFGFFSRGLTLICADQFLSAEKEQSDEVFMRALP